MKIVVKKPGEDYYGDILFRVYLGQEHSDIYAFEVLHKTGSGIESEYVGQYTAEYPSGAQHLMEKLLVECKDKQGVLMISNELDNIPPTHDRDWFDQAIKNALAGEYRFAVSA